MFLTGLYLEHKNRNWLNGQKKSIVPPGHEFCDTAACDRKTIPTGMNWLNVYKQKL